MGILKGAGTGQNLSVIAEVIEGKNLEDNRVRRTIPLIEKLT